MALLKFLKGNYAGLSAKAISEGQVLICGDTGEMFVDVAADKRVKIGDFVVVSDINALEALDASSVPTSRLYYVENGNILARSNGTSWTQINKQKTLAELGGVSKSVYDAKMTALDKADSDNATAIDNLSKYVGTIPTTATATDVVGYINEKTSGIASESAMTELGNRVTQAEKDIDAIEADYLKDADKTELTGKITAAQTAADNAQTYAEGVAGDLADHEADAVAHITAAEREAWNGKTTMADVEKKGYLVADDIAGKANAADVYDKDAIDAKVETINDAIDLKANAADVYDKDAIDAKVEALEGEDDRLEGLINGKVAQTAYDEKVGELVSEDERLAGLISDNATAIADEITNRGTAISGLKSELEGKINAKVAQADYDAKVAALEAEDERIAGLVATEKSRAEGVEAGLEGRLVEVEAFFKLAEGEQLDTALDTLKEIQTYITSEGAAADQMVLDIAANKKAIEDHVATDHDFASADAALKSELNGEIAKKADKTTVEGIDGRLTTAEGKVSTLEGKMTAVEGAVATKAEKTYVDEEIAKLESADTGLGNRITTLETESAKHALKTEVEAVSTALENYKTAHKDDYTNTQIDDAIEVVADDLAEYVEAHKNDYTNTAIDSAISTAIANAGHAAAADLTAHTGNTDVHVTTADKEKWNKAQENAEATAASALASARTAISTEIDADVKVEADRAKGVEAGLQTAIDTINNAENGILAQAKSDATSKANTAESNAKSYADGLMTWGSF